MSRAEKRRKERLIKKLGGVVGEAPPREHVAVHEAGHAVMATRLGIETALVEIDLDPKKDGRSGGHHPTSAPVEAFRCILLSAAGVIAEELVLGDAAPTNSSDAANARRYAEEARIVYHPRDWLHMAAVILRPIQPAVRTVADALLERGKLTGEEVVLLVRGAMPDWSELPAIEGGCRGVVDG